VLTHKTCELFFELPEDQTGNVDLMIYLQSNRMLFFDSA
jgi:hypothetical protein